MSKKKSQRPTTEQILDTLDDLCWFGVCLLDKAGKMLKDTFTCVGPDLVPGFVEEHRQKPFQPGVYTIGAWIPKRGKSMPDWGTVVVRGPGSWILRSRDGREVWAADSGGMPICLRAEGGER